MLYSAFVLTLYDSRNSKFSSHFLSKLVYKQLWLFIRNLLSRISSIRHLSNVFRDRNRNIKSILQAKSTCKSLKNWRKHTFNSNLRLSERLAIFSHRNDFATLSRLYNNWTSSTVMQKLRKLRMIYIQIEHESVWIFQNFFTSKRLRNIKSILQQLNEIDSSAKTWKITRDTQSIWACVCLNVSQFFCIQIVSSFQKSRSIRNSKLHTMRKRQIREVFNNVCWFKQSSKSCNAKTRKCDENIHTNQICFRFDISTIFIFEKFYSISSFFSLDFLCFLLQDRINHDEFSESSIIFDHT